MKIITAILLIIALAASTAACDTAGGSTATTTDSTGGAENITSTPDSATPSTTAPAQAVDPSEAITQNGTYELTGEITGQVLVTAQKVTLVLNNVTINCAEGPAILGYFEGGKQDLVIELKGQNTVKSGDSHAIQGKDNLYICGEGAVNLSAVKDGLHGGDYLEVQSGTVLVSSSYEGFESPQINIKGGNITIFADDDGINAAGDEATGDYNLTIEGGTVVLYTGSDGIDSNGTLTITGGQVAIFINAPRDGDCTDTDRGGTIIPALYGSKSLAKGATLSVGDAFSITLEADATSYFISFPGLVEGTAYDVNVNGSFYETVTATATIQGMMFGGGGFGGFGGGGRPNGGQKPGGGSIPTQPQ